MYNKTVELRFRNFVHLLKKLKISIEQFKFNFKNLQQNK